MWRGMKRVAVVLLGLLFMSGARAHDEALDLDGLMAAFGWDFKSAEITTEKVTDGLYVLFGIGGNIGVSVGPQGVLIVDDQFPEMTAKIAQARARIYEFNKHHSQLSDHFIALVEDGLAIPRTRYEEALETRNRAQRVFETLFMDVDVVLTPAAPGEAPEGLSATGDPLYNRIWTLLQVPCVSVPFGTGPLGLPLSIQLVGRVGGDDRLLAAADWVHRSLRV